MKACGNCTVILPTGEKNFATKFENAYLQNCVGYRTELTILCQEMLRNVHSEDVLIFSEEACFYNCCKVNKEHYRYWSNTETTPGNSINDHSIAPKYTQSVATVFNIAGVIGPHFGSKW